MNGWSNHHIFIAMIDANAYQDLISMKWDASRSFVVNAAMGVD